MYPYHVPRAAGPVAGGSRGRRDGLADPLHLEKGKREGKGLNRERYVNMWIDKGTAGSEYKARAKGMRVWVPSATTSRTELIQLRES